jgi:hypothetical protein
MKQNVGWPVVLLLFIVLAAGIYAYYRFIFSRPAAPINTAADIPPRRPGDDKPATPPPGVVVPGTIKR